MELKKEEMALRREQLNMEEKIIIAKQKRQAQMQEQLRFNKGSCSSKCKLRPSPRLSLWLCWPR